MGNKYIVKPRPTAPFREMLPRGVSRKFFVTKFFMYTYAQRDRRSRLQLEKTINSGGAAPVLQVLGGVQPPQPPASYVSEQ